MHIPTPGFVYAMQNIAMPGLIKIGKTTTTPAQRCDELSSSTSVPTPFTIICAVHLEDCHRAEQDLHARLKKRRIWAGKEFFHLDEQEAKELLASLGAIASYQAKRYRGQKIRKNHQCPMCDARGRVRVAASVFFSVFEPCPNSYKTLE